MLAILYLRSMNLVRTLDQVLLRTSLPAALTGNVFILVIADSVPRSCVSHSGSDRRN